MKTLGIIALTIFCTLAVVVGILIRLPVSETDGLECGPRSEVVKTLGTNFGQREGFVGVVSQNAVLEILFNDETGTWTALRTTSDGVSCVTVYGPDYRETFLKSEK